jgi:hypothetical protein
MDGGDAFEVVTRTMLDNLMFSVKVPHRHEERNSRVEIVPNPFGGVNTHLWRNEAYIVGIVPVVRPAYSVQKKEWERNRRGRGLLVGFSVSRQNVACYPNRKF